MEQQDPQLNPKFMGKNGVYYKEAAEKHESVMKSTTGNLVQSIINEDPSRRKPLESVIHLVTHKNYVPYVTGDHLTQLVMSQHGDISHISSLHPNASVEHKAVHALMHSDCHFCKDGWDLDKLMDVRNRAR